jgi:pimeloyl-ACP methyl ester carboxylesterase
MWVVNQFPTELPQPAGPFAVGRTILTWVDEPQNVRELVAWIWYPATAHPVRTGDYLPPRWRDALARSGGVLMTDFLTRDLAKVRIHSADDAPLAPAQRQYPVVLLLPGSGALAAGYTALAEDLASHGYIVVGLNAARLTTAVVLPDGQVIYRAARYDLDSLPESQAERLARRLVNLWSDDVGFAIDRLEALDTPDSGSPFAGRLDLQQLGIVGHSLGGAIAANFCHADSRCKAGIDLDGRLFGPAITAGLSQPFMFIFEDVGRDPGPEAAHVLSEVHSMYARLETRSRIGISIAGANHFTFTDQMLVKDPIPLTILRHAGAISGLSGTRGLRITEDYVSTFFGVYLKGQSPSELKGLERKYPEVRVW